ncbi:hypothetical protein MDOR_35670 [Mycolicibacterium doricum]|uniref:Uncharacterized protein n=1 Tax=Mycolicibacterium doricum TaxID=126673 RepID=A0A1X1THU0_9MYCO|nr:hypothetical protein AWC01_04810 [Mycolicibacterium doricum]BBZ09398.1 hypothetical protein MDOR_35670 [Mycolicibacterium doricum]
MARMTQPIPGPDAAKRPGRLPRDDGLPQFRGFARFGVVDPDDGLVAGLQERRLPQFGVASQFGVARRADPGQ